MVQETGVAELLLLLLGVFNPGLREQAGSDDSWKPDSIGHSIGVGVIATGCSGS